MVIQFCQFGVFLYTGQKVPNLCLDSIFRNEYTWSVNLDKNLLSAASTVSLCKFFQTCLAESSAFSNQTARFIFFYQRFHSGGAWKLFVFCIYGWYTSCLTFECWLLSWWSQEKHTMLLILRSEVPWKPLVEHFFCYWEHQLFVNKLSDFLKFL